MELDLFAFDFEPVPAPKVEVLLPAPATKPAPSKPTQSSRAPFNNHAAAFRAVAKFYGFIDGTYDDTELARFANELICGIRSDRPTMTPHRWGMARSKVLELAGVRVALQRTGGDWAERRRELGKKLEPHVYASMVCTDCSGPLMLTQAQAGGWDWACLDQCDERLKEAA